MKSTRPLRSNSQWVATGGGLGASRSQSLLQGLRDNGRLWDCLLGLLDPETSARYPDPVLQTNVEFSYISYVATANTLEPLPAVLLDRFRIIAFPKPTLNDLDASCPV
ncbi:hypothetical protein ACTZWT_14655 [Rhodopseudomonas sp. NSM]